MERRNTSQIENAFSWVQESLFEGGWEPDTPVAGVVKVEALFRESRVRDTLTRMLLESADLGVTLVATQFEQLNLSFDWTLAHADARDWAEQYTNSLLQQLGTTNNRVVGQAIRRWINNGEPLTSLVRDLRIVFGRDRAERIAITETTRAFAEGTLQGYARAGYGENRPTQIIPKHVRCRCGYGLRFNKDGSANFIFFTSADEHVCAICIPLNGQEIGLAKSPDQPGLF